MAKKEVAKIKLQIPAGAANPSPPVGPALGQHGLNIMGFCKEFNARTMELNLFDNLGRNKGFLQVMGIIVIVQIVMTYFGGEVMHCHGLNASELFFVLLMAVTIIPIDILKKIILGSYKK